MGRCTHSTRTPSTPYRGRRWERRDSSTARRARPDVDAEIPQLIRICAALAFRLAPLPLLGDAGFLGGAGGLGRPSLLPDHQRPPNQVGEPRLGCFAILLLAATRARD